MIGTRPEAIKIAPVAHALRSRGVAPSLVLTGQHPNLALSDFGLAGFDTIELRCPGQRDPHAHVQSVCRAMRTALHAAADLLVVQGDTSSALGGALGAFAAGIAVAHVEAGLRTHDLLLPWPEEEYRVAIDAGAQLLFAPTETAAANLRAENLSGEIYVTGNTGIDTLLAVEARLPRPTLRDGGIPRVLVTCHRRESWSGGLQSIAAALIELAKRSVAEIDVILHPNPHVASQMRSALEGFHGISLLEPVNHSELVRRIRDSDLVLSDSGGIQEEAPSLATPLLVLREKTERPEAIESGNARLVGTCKETIVAEAGRLLQDPIERAGMARRAFPFGDGRSGPRIAALIQEWLGRHSGGASSAAVRNS